ncbi:MAG TPA: glycosyltransferase family 39 protein [Azospirillaceae bacterium]|nr:glycosyltransferase family 39 protein [Azospirillaceae bacterium]
MRRQAGTIDGAAAEAGGRRMLAAALVGVALLVGLLVRLAYIGREPLWLDEAYTVWFATIPLADLWGRTPAFEPHPPLYYTLLHFWTGLFGTGEAGVRSLSAVLNTAAIPFVYLAGRRIGGAWTGAAAALVFSLMPFQLEWSQNARAYGLGALPVAALCWALLRIAAEPEQAARPLWRLSPGSDPGARSLMAAWATVALATGFFLWLHNTYPLVVFVVQLLAFAWWLGPGGRRAGFVVNWVAANAAAFLIWAWWVPHLLGMAAKLSDGFVIPPPTLRNLVSHLSLYFTINDFWKFRSLWAVPDLLYFGAGAAGALGLLLARRWTAAGLVIGLCALPLALYVGFSIAFVPAYQPKLMAWIGVPYALMVACGLALIPRPWLRAGALAVVAAGLFAGVRVDYEAPPREGWDGAAAVVAAEWRPGEPVLTVSMSSALAVGYYLERLGADIPLTGTPADWPDGWNGYRPVTEADRAALAARLEGAERAWLVVRTNSWTADPQRIVEQELRRFGEPAGSWNTGGVEVYRYARRPPG